MAARILSGETPESIPVMEGPPALAQVDWRQLRRWNIPESALPLGRRCLRIGRQHSWQHYAKYFGAGLLLILVQAVLIIGLLLAKSPEPESRPSSAGKRRALPPDGGYDPCPDLDVRPGRHGYLSE